jgi:hypothetical protein
MSRLVDINDWDSQREKSYPNRQPFLIQIFLSSHACLGLWNDGFCTMAIVAYSGAAVLEALWIRPRRIVYVAV